LIRREVKIPKGSGDRESGWSNLKGKLQRARSVEAAKAGANRIWQRSRRVERAVKPSGLVAK